MTLDTGVISLVVSSLAVIGVVYNIAVQFTSLKVKVDLLYLIYVEDELRHAQQGGRVVSRSQSRLSREFAVTLDPAVRKVARRSCQPGMEPGECMARIYKQSKNRIHSEAKEKGLSVGELLVSYLMYGNGDVEGKDA